MILWSKSRWLWLAVLSILFVVASASAQDSPVVYEGKIGSLQVAQTSGDHYYWKIYTNSALTIEASSSEAVFLSGNQSSGVYVQWKKRGNYYYTVLVSKYTGCTNLKVGKIRVLPIMLAAVAGKDTTIGACRSARLDASKSIGNIASYQWSMIDPYGTLSNPNGMTTNFTMAPSYPGTLPANFRVKLLVTDSSGNTASDTVKVIVDQAPNADVYISGKLQKDGSMLVDGTVSTGIGLQYQWSTNNGSIIGDNRRSTVSLNGAGLYSLEITDSHGCKSVKSFKFPLVTNILIANPDYARTSWAEDVKIPILENDIDSDHDIKLSSVRITNKPKRGGVVVNSDGTVTYSSSINKSGNDQFIYQVCDSVGLCDSALVVVDVFDAGLKIPEAFSPNGDGANEQLVFQGLENYPKSQLYVYTRSGQLVYESEDYLNDWDGRTAKSSATGKEKLPTGTYYYILKLGGTSRTIKGFVYIGY